jgi:hypothetical protein
MLSVGKTSPERKATSGCLPRGIAAYAHPEYTETTDACHPCNACPTCPTNPLITAPHAKLLYDTRYITLLFSCCMPASDQLGQIAARWFVPLRHDVRHPLP